MASSLLTPALASSAKNRKHYNFSISIISTPQSKNLHLGICKFSTWNGLKHQGLPTSRYIVKIERRGRRSQKGVYASLFGVGAPEVLVIGVVALLVFGPKGLAEVARNIGQTIRAFQPTIRELQDVSRELKSTLEREIGLDDIQDTNKSTLDSSSTSSSVEPDGSLPSNKSLTTEDYLKILGEKMKKQKELEQAEAKSRESLIEPQGDGLASSSNASLSEERAMTAEEQLEASAGQKEVAASVESSVEPERPSQVADVSPSPNTADTVQEYLKKLELEWQTENSKKQKKMASSATDVKSQDGKEVTSVTPLSEKAESGDQIKITKEKLEMPAAEQQKEMASAESLVEQDGQPKDGSPYPIKPEAVQDYLKKLEQDWEALNSEKQKMMASSASEIKSRDTHEAISAEPLSQNTESEDQMKTTKDQLEASAAQQQKDEAPAEILVEPQGQSQGSINQYSKKQKKMASAAQEVKSQVSHEQEVASAESKDRMSEENHNKDRSSAVHQLL